MLTIFSIPKPFIGHIGTIQMNALRSWTFLNPKCQIIIFGDETGVAEAAAKIGALHVPEIARNELGTPRLDWAFGHAQEVAEHRLTCYLNSDVIVLDDLPKTAAGIEFPEFLMIGERIDLNVVEPLDFGPDWQVSLRADAELHGSRHGPTGMDYFVFPTGMIRNMPAFVVGRAGWDNWMVYNARTNGIPVINASHAVCFFHQTHDYAHHAGPEKGTWHDPESIANLGLLDHPNKTQFLLHDATWKVKCTGGKPVRAWRHLLRVLDTLILIYPSERYAVMRLFAPVIIAIRFVVRRCRWLFLATKYKLQKEFRTKVKNET